MPERHHLSSVTRYFAGARTQPAPGSPASELRFRSRRHHRLLAGGGVTCTPDSHRRLTCGVPMALMLAFCFFPIVPRFWRVRVRLAAREDRRLGRSGAVRLLRRRRCRNLPSDGHYRPLKNATRAPRNCARNSRNVLLRGNSRMNCLREGGLRVRHCREYWQVPRQLCHELRLGDGHRVDLERASGGQHLLHADEGTLDLQLEAIRTSST